MAAAFNEVLSALRKTAEAGLTREEKTSSRSDQTAVRLCFSLRIARPVRRRF